jgi:uracil-DNA glycosylase
MYLNKELLADKDWQKVLGDYFLTDKYIQLNHFLSQRALEGATIFPPKDQVFSAFNLTPLSQVKVVVLGQDPYHKQGQAHGLSFSVNKGVQVPPSLKNIYKKFNKDVGMKIPNSGCLENWAKQGVLLLNTILTVEEGAPASHRKKGWEQLTDYVLSYLIENKKHLVFLLWGNFAKEKKILFKENLIHHKIMEAAHPAPPYSHTKFLNDSESFNEINRYLVQHQIESIKWEFEPDSYTLF